MLDQPKIYWREVLPPESTPMSAELQGVYNYWHQLCGEEDIPRWAEFDFLNLGRDIVPWCTVVDVSREPLDFIYRFYGSSFVVYQTADYTGKSVRDVKRRAISQKIFEELHMVADMAMPALFETTSTEMPGLIYRHLRLPFGVGHDVTQVLNVGVYEEKTMQKMQKFFDLLD